MMTLNLKKKGHPFKRETFLINAIVADSFLKFGGITSGLLRKGSIYTGPIPKTYSYAVL